MRFFPSSLPLVLIPLLLPATAAEEASSTAGNPAAAKACGQRADEAMGIRSRVDHALRELGAPSAPATAAAEAPMPEAVEGQCVTVSDGGMFFDAANSQLVYLHNVRLSDVRVKLRAANRLYIQLPRQEEEKAAAQSSPAPAAAQPAPEAAPAPAVAATPAPAAPPQTAATREPAEVQLPLEVDAYDALVDSVANRILCMSGPGVPVLRFRQGESLVELTEGDGAPARMLADEQGNILMEAPLIHLRWKAEDGSVSEFRTTGGRVLFHAATHALMMDGVEASYRDGESTMQCSGPFCVTLQPEAGAPARDASRFMGQFTSMRYSGIAAASATGNVQLVSGMSGEGMSVSGDALFYNGLTGEVEVPGTPCILTYGKNGANALQTYGSLVLTPEGDIHFRGEGNIEGVYSRPARDEGAAPLQGTLTAKAPLSFHAANGTMTTSALHAQDAEASLSCTGEVLVTLSPRTEAELAEANLPEREDAGMVNLAIARYKDIAAIKAVGEVRGRMMDASNPAQPVEEASVSASRLDANLVSGEMLLTGKREAASIAFRGYSLGGTADALTSASVHLKPNGDIEARGVQVTCTVPGDKGVTTLTCTDRMLLAREARSISMGPGTRIQSPDGIVTTNGSMQAVLAAATGPVKPLSPRYPHLTYDFSGLDSAETFEGGSVRTAQGSMQCSQHLSILMLPAGSAEKSALGGVRSAIATGHVLVAARDNSNRVMRAAGDRLEVDGLTGEKRLTGSRVVLEDARNRHEASGEGAAVRIDARNNARITGARHASSATGIREQVEENKAQNQQNKSK